MFIVDIFYLKYIVVFEVNMKRLKVNSYLTNEDLQKRIKKEKAADQLKVWQCIYYIQNHDGVSAADVSDIFGLSIHSVYKYVQSYNLSGVDGVILKQRGGRRRFYLSLERERELLDSLSQKASEGLVLTMNDIRDEIESTIGHSISDDYIWDLLNRHNWKKKAPRPKHPDQDLEKQEGFKKKLKKTWQPSN